MCVLNVLKVNLKIWKILSSKVALIEENKKLIEEKGLFEEDYDDI
jgi:hypothetical protein